MQSGLQIWTKDTAEYHGQIVDFPPMRLASYRINGETGALTPLTGQWHGFWQLIRLRGDDMEIGAAIFFTDYSMVPTDLAVALEQRGFDSLREAEHCKRSLIPTLRRTTAMV